MIALACFVLAQSKFHGGATLLSTCRAVRPGEASDVAVRITMEPGWHTYWQNPGDAGIPPTIKWKLPAGWSAGPIRWPLPKRLVAPEVVSFGYESEAMLLVRLTAPRSARLGDRLSLKAHVDWLVCQDGCIPASADVDTPISIAAVESKDPVWAPRIQKVIAALPNNSPRSVVNATGADKEISIHFAGRQMPSSVSFFPSDPVIEPSAPQLYSQEGGHGLLKLKMSQYAEHAPSRLRGILVTSFGATVLAEGIDIPLVWRKL